MSPGYLPRFASVTQQCADCHVPSPYFEGQACDSHQASAFCIPCLVYCSFQGS